MENERGYKFLVRNERGYKFLVRTSCLLCGLQGNFAKALISENGNIAQKYEKLLLCKGYHILIDLYQSYKQLSKGKVLPPQMVPICGLAHGLLMEAQVALIAAFSLPVL